MTFDREYSLEPGSDLWEGKVPVPPGLDVEWLVTAEQSNNAYCLAKYTMHNEVLPHVHRNDDEALFILEGEPTVTIVGKPHRLKPGGFIFMPRDRPHSISSEGPWTCLGISAPAGFELLIKDLGELTASGDLSPEKVAAVQAKHGVKNLESTESDLDAVRDGAWWGDDAAWRSNDS